MKHILFLATIFSISSFSQQNITMDVGDFNSLTIYDGIKVELKKSWAWIWTSTINGQNRKGWIG